MKNLFNPQDLYQFDHIKDHFDRLLHKICLQVRMFILKFIYMDNCLDRKITEEFDKRIIELGIITIKKGIYNSSCFKVPALVARFKAIRNESPFADNELSFDDIVLILKEVIREAINEQQQRIMMDIFKGKTKNDLLAHIDLEKGFESKEMQYLLNIVNMFTINQPKIDTKMLEDAILLSVGDPLIS